MLRWEYCVVSHVPSGPVIVTVAYYTLEGARVVQHRAKSYDDSTATLWPGVIASLGREGWELVAVDAGALYFKRPLTDNDQANHSA